MDKILRINVGAEGGPKASVEPLGEYAGLGGRAMTTTVVCKEVPPTMLKNPACSGVFLWQYADCRVTEEWAMHRPKTHNNKGVVDEYRRPKMSYAVVKELFTKHRA